MWSCYYKETSLISHASLESSNKSSSSHSSPVTVRYGYFLSLSNSEEENARNFIQKFEQLSIFAQRQPLFPGFHSSTHWGLVMPYGNTGLCQQWHQAITWTNVNFSLIRFWGIHLGAITQQVSQLLFCIMSLKTILLNYCHISQESVS